VAIVLALLLAAAGTVAAVAVYRYVTPGAGEFITEGPGPQPVQPPPSSPADRAPAPSAKAPSRAETSASHPAPAPSTSPAARPPAAPAKSPRREEKRAPDFHNVEPSVRYDFSNPRSGWAEGTNRLGIERGYANGKYFLKSDKRFNYFQGHVGNRFANFACEAVGRFASPGATAWGLTLSHPAREDGRLGVWVTIGRNGLQIHPNGLEAEQADTHAEEIASPAIKPVEEFNRLLVVLRERRLEVYVNGVSVGDPVPVSADLSPAAVALCARFGPRGGKVEFERLTVWPADRLPAPLPRGGGTP
jgi:hypothetical protein